MKTIQTDKPVTASVKSQRSLIGVDSNAYGIMACVNKGLKLAGAKPDEIAAVMADMQAGDYDYLLMVASANTTNGGAGGEERGDPGPYDE